MRKFLLTAICLAGLSFISISTASAQISVGVNIGIAPPALPVYEQPYCPGEGYIWTPGYWAYGPDGYYWVPGAWVLAPRPGLLWTPGYWAFVGGYYRWHAGYWGAHVGYYGGINYGFGYTGIGFGGGMWVGNVYRYNTAVTRVNTTVIHNTYVNNTYIVNNNTNRYSYNGTGGVTRGPDRSELAYNREQRIAPTAQQRTFAMDASRNRNQLASANNGRPERLFRENTNAQQNSSNGSMRTREMKQNNRTQQRMDHQAGETHAQMKGHAREQRREAKAERKAERRKDRRQ